MSGAARPTDREAVRYGEQLRAISEALEHLLDPLEEPVPTRHRTPANEAARAARPGTRRSLRKLVARVRWSDRDRFRIPRLLTRWALLIAFVWAVVWLVSTHVSV